jgi:hypothetical protein
MIRCRECRGLLVDTADEFVLAPQVTAVDQPKCARCGAVLESGVDDCPNCASVLLDDLLKGPAEVHPAPDSGSSNSTSQLRPRETATSAPAKPADFVPLREVATPVPPTRTVPPKQKSGKSSGSAKGRNAIEDDPPGLFGDDDDTPPAPTRREPPRPVAVPRSPASEEESHPEGGVETSAACAALLASLAGADATLRVEIATALGKLGDRAAMGPLERHLVDQDIRVRRAVAAALVQLGHPKGETLLDIAERKPAAAVLTAAKGSPAPKPKRTSGGMEIDGAAVKKLGIAVAAIAVVGGGIWYFMFGSGGSSGSSRGRKKPKAKSSATKKVSAVSSPFSFVSREA